MTTMSHAGKMSAERESVGPSVCWKKHINSLHHPPSVPLFLLHHHTLTVFSALAVSVLIRKCIKSLGWHAILCRSMNISSLGPPPTLWRNIKKNDLFLCVVLPTNPFLWDTLACFLDNRKENEIKSRRRSGGVFGIQKDKIDCWYTNQELLLLKRKRKNSPLPTKRVRKFLNWIELSTYIVCHKEEK